MRTIQTIDKAIEILNYLAKENEEASLTLIARDLNMKISTLHGIIYTLEHHGLVYKNNISGRFSLGMYLFEMGKIMEKNFSLTQTLRPYLVEIEREIEETVHLAKVVNNQLLYIDKVETLKKLRMTSLVGETESFYDSAIGLVILSFLPSKKRQELFNNNNIISEKLLKKLETIQVEKIYEKYEEEENFYCVAIPVLTGQSTIFGAISVAIPEARYTKEKKKKTIDYLLKIEKELSTIFTNSIPYKCLDTTL